MKLLRVRLARTGIAAVVLAGLAWLSGCASVPEPLRIAPEQSPDPELVRVAPQQYVGTTVRWGGVIVSVENGPAESVIAVVARPLDKSARPLESNRSTGRFLARIDGFVDPMDYAAGREITVVGRVDGVERHDIGTYPYPYPVVRATAYHLWPLRPPPVQDPYFYSPFYHPWYPYGPYPYPYW